MSLLSSVPAKTWRWIRSKYLCKDLQCMLRHHDQCQCKDCHCKVAQDWCNLFFDDVSILGYMQSKGSNLTSFHPQLENSELYSVLLVSSSVKKGTEKVIRLERPLDIGRKNCVSFLCVGKSLLSSGSWGWQDKSTKLTSFLNWCLLSASPLLCLQPRWHIHKVVMRKHDKNIFPTRPKCVKPFFIRAKDSRRKILEEKRGNEMS